MLSLERLDRWLIEVPYQRLVDSSQRTPAWWVENSAWAMAVSAWVELGVRGWTTQPFNLFATVVMSIFAALVIAASRVKNGLPHLLSSAVIRHMTLVLTVMGLLSVMLRDDPLAFLRLANSLAYISIWYFAACTPPAPKKRKRTQLASIAVR